MWFLIHVHFAEIVKSALLWYLSLQVYHFCLRTFKIFFWSDCEIDSTFLLTVVTPLLTEHLNLLLSNWDFEPVVQFSPFSLFSAFGGHRSILCCINNLLFHVRMNSCHLCLSVAGLFHILWHPPGSSKIYVVLFYRCCFQAESQIFQPGFKLTMWSRMTLNSWSSCLSLLSTGTCCHIWFKRWDWTQDLTMKDKHSTSLAPDFNF